MSSRNRFVLIVLLLLVLASGWYFWQSLASTRPVPKQMAQEKTRPLVTLSPQQKPSRANATSSPTAMSADGTVAVPARYRLPGVERVRTAKNFKEWLAQFPLDQQAFIADFDKTHFSVYSTITSPQQVAWMAARGYPMPEDIVAAKNISDEELKQLAAGGNDKAGFLLNERQATLIRSKIDAYVAGGGTESELLRNDVAFAIERSRVNDNLRAIYTSSESPYKGYVMAEEASMLRDPDARSAGIIAGLLWANTYGDTRAGSDAMYNFVKGNPDLQRQEVAALNMISALRMDQQRLNCYPVPPASGWMIPAKVWQ